MFRTRYTLRGTSYLVHRIGWSVQVPTQRPVERDEMAIMTWRREVWLPEVERLRSYPLRPFRFEGHAGLSEEAGDEVGFPLDLS